MRTLFEMVPSHVFCFTVDFCADTAISATLFLSVTAPVNGGEKRLFLAYGASKCQKHKNTY